MKENQEINLVRRIAWSLATNERGATDKIIDEAMALANRSLEQEKQDE